MDSKIKLSDKYFSTNLSKKTCVIKKEH